MRERLDEGLDYVKYNPEIYIENHAGDFVFPELFLERERLFEPSEILPGLVIPPGRYRHKRVRLEVGTSRDRALAIEGSVFIGDYFSGRRRDYNLALIWQPHRHYNLRLDYGINDVDLREGRFVGTGSGPPLQHPWHPEHRFPLAAQERNAIPARPTSGGGSVPCRVSPRSTQPAGGASPTGARRHGAGACARKVGYS